MTAHADLDVFNHQHGDYAPHDHRDLGYSELAEEMRAMMSVTRPGDPIPDIVMDFLWIYHDEGIELDGEVYIDTHEGIPLANEPKIVELVPPPEVEPPAQPQQQQRQPPTAPTFYTIGGTAFPADTKFNLLFKATGEYIFGPTVPYRTSPNGQLYEGVPGSQSGYGDVGPAPKSAVWNYLMKKFEGKYGKLNAQTGTPMDEPEPDTPDFPEPTEVTKPPEKPPQAQTAGVETVGELDVRLGPGIIVVTVPTAEFVTASNSYRMQVWKTGSGPGNVPSYTRNAIAKHIYPATPAMIAAEMNRIGITQANYAKWVEFNRGAEAASVLDGYYVGPDGVVEIPDGYSVSPNGSMKKIPKRVNVYGTTATVIYRRANGVVSDPEVWVLGGFDEYPDDKGIVHYVYHTVVYKNEHHTPWTPSGYSGQPIGPGSEGKATNGYGRLSYTSRHWDGPPTIDADKSSITAPF